MATVLVVIGTAAAAQALRTGTYSGTSADGNFISLTVTGPFPYKMTNMNVGFQAACPNTGGKIASESWGAFLGTPITSSGADFATHNDYYDIEGNLTFQDTKTIVGHITSRTAVFVPGATPPAAAMFCKSPSQQFTLKWQGTPAQQPPVSAVVMQKPAK